MSFRRFGGRSRRPRRSFNVIDSNKNILTTFQAGAAGTKTELSIAKAVDAAANTGTDEVTRGSKIFRIWVEFWAYTTAETAVGVTNGIDAYLIKNPGSNLTTPNPGTVGSSNEKKFVFRIWKGLVGARTQGSTMYGFRGWIKIPKTYQRMGADDLIQMVFTFTGVNGLLCQNYVYKWYK